MIVRHLYQSTRVAAFVATAVAIAASAGLSAVPSYAAAPMVKTPAPGYFRVMLGDFEVTALSDGTLDLPVNKILTNTTAKKVDQALAKVNLKSPLETSVNAFLINTGGKLVLIDAGAGTLFGPTLGKFVANLRASGYQPEQIDEIYITHMHGDHLGGLAANGELTFPNAIVRAQKHESDFWLNQANMDKAGADMKDFFQGAMVSINPYVKAGKYRPIDGNVELVPGVKSQASIGHTAGHSSYIVESKGEKLVLIGDMIHVAAVQFANPSVTIAFDGDPKSAAAARKKAFSEAAKANYLIGGSHLQFPGIGRIHANGKGFQWVPINYTQMR